MYSCARLQFPTCGEFNQRLSPTKADFAIYGVAHCGNTGLYLHQSVPEVYITQSMVLLIAGNTGLYLQQSVPVVYITPGRLHSTSLYKDHQLFTDLSFRHQLIVKSQN